MDKKELIEMLEEIGKEYDAQLSHERGYPQIKINGCLFNVDNRPDTLGFISVNALCRRAGKVSVPRVDREKIAKDFNILSDSMFNATYGDNPPHSIFRNSIGFIYQEVNAKDFERLIRWVLRDIGPKSKDDRWLSQRIITEILNKILGAPGQIEVTPSFLHISGKQHQLRLDCYWHSLSLAMEYNGFQHYHFPNPFHKTRQEFEAQLERDRTKKEACLGNGVYLLEIPYTTELTIDSILDFLGKLEDLPQNVKKLVGGYT